MTRSVECQWGFATDSAKVLDAIEKLSDVEMSQRVLEV
jgi:hypothetical protein